MKRNSATVICLCLAVGSFATAQEESPFFDLENCGICKTMSNVDGLFEKVKCETEIIDNGMITVSVVPDDMKDAVAAAHKDMEAAIEKLMAGEKMELCGFCKSMGKLHQAGAQIQKYNTDSAEVMLITSDDAAVVDIIHEHAKKAIAAKEEMMEKMKHGDKVSLR